MTHLATHGHLSLNMVYQHLVVDTDIELLLEKHNTS